MYPFYISIRCRVFLISIFATDVDGLTSWLFQFWYSLITLDNKRNLFILTGKKNPHQNKVPNVCEGTTFPIPFSCSLHQCRYRYIVSGPSVSHTIANKIIVLNWLLQEPFKEILRSAPGTKRKTIKSKIAKNLITDPICSYLFLFLEKYCPSYNYTHIP